LEKSSERPSFDDLRSGGEQLRRDRQDRIASAFFTPRLVSVARQTERRCRRRRHGGGGEPSLHTADMHAA
jgi:hypothetical protein